MSYIFITTSKVMFGLILPEFARFVWHIRVAGTRRSKMCRRFNRLKVICLGGVGSLLYTISFFALKYYGWSAYLQVLAFARAANVLASESSK